MTPAEIAALDTACAPRADALRGFATGARSAHGKSTEREQSIFTPLWLVQPLIDAWGSIALDPCAHPDSPVSAIAETCYCAPKSDGLTALWVDRTYVNPPFGTLKDWLEKALVEVYRAHATARIAVLVPVRTHRRWWREAALQTDRGVYLDPVPFAGHKSAFPAPLALFLYGPQSDAVAKAYEAAELGGVL